MTPVCAVPCCAAVLTNVYNALEDGGFLLFFEMTTVLPTLLWGLDAQCWNFEDEREFGLWVKRERWEQLLAEVGFTQVRRAPSGVLVGFGAASLPSWHYLTWAVSKQPNVGRPVFSKWLQCVWHCTPPKAQFMKWKV